MCIFCIATLNFGLAVEFGLSLVQFWTDRCLQVPPGGEKDVLVD